MTIKRPTRQTCPSARPMNRIHRKADFTSSAAQRRAREAPAQKAVSVVPTPKQRRYAFRAPE
jgi:hypothetical protein